MGLKVERRRRNWCYYLKIDQAHALVSAIGLVLVLLVLVRLISKAVSSVRRNYIGAWKTSIPVSYTHLDVYKRQAQN